MKIAVIKKWNERIPAWVKSPFAPLIRRQLTENQEFQKQYRELCRLDSASEQERQEKQLEDLRAMLRYAQKNVPYYRNLFAQHHFRPDEVESVDDLERLPILTKEILRTHYEEMLSEEPLDFYIVQTGGTTGAPLTIAMERRTIFREWAFVYHYWSKFGYDYRHSRLATFRGVDFGKKLWKVNPLYREIRMNPARMNKENVAAYLKRINRYGADFLYGYPSAIEHFCRLCEEEGISIVGRFRAVFLISENCYPFQEACITRVTQAPIAIFYGHSERAVFAEQCHGAYRFQPAYGVCELSDAGQPLVTGFLNHKLPLIRYEVDDCVTGTAEDGYQILGHRDSSVLYGKNGEEISAATINVHDDTFADVEAYQFIQEQKGECRLCLESPVHLPAQQLEQISSRISEKLGIACKVVQVERMQLTKRGKYQMIIQKVKP